MKGQGKKMVFKKMGAKHKYQKEKKGKTLKEESE